MQVHERFHFPYLITLLVSNMVIMMLHAYQRLSTIMVVRRRAWITMNSYFIWDLLECQSFRNLSSWAMGLDCIPKSEARVALPMKAMEFPLPINWE